MHLKRKKKIAKEEEEEVMFDYKKRKEGIKVLFNVVVIFHNYIYRVDESDRISRG